jgi:L-fuculose-phosphate aldolase
MYELQKKYEKEIQKLVSASARLSKLGFVASHGGNLSTRVEEDIILITPTKIAKRYIKFDDIVIINIKGDVLFASKGRKPTAEILIFIRIFEKRPDIKGLVHAHPPVLTGFAISDSNLLSRPFLPEPIIEVGPILSVDYIEPVTMKLAKAFDKVIHKTNAFLMKNHGVMVCSNEDADRALDLLEMIEAQAFSVFIATVIDKAMEIPREEVDNLERTLRNRGLCIPGDPRMIKNLWQLFNKK